jgi:hypothetical protein
LTTVRVPVARSADCHGILEFSARVLATVGSRQLVTWHCGGSLESDAHVLGGPNQFPEPVVITSLNAGRGNHDRIMVSPAGRSTTRDRITTWLAVLSTTRAEKSKMLSQTARLPAMGRAFRRR